MNLEPDNKRALITGRTQASADDALARLREELPSNQPGSNS